MSEVALSRAYALKQIAESLLERAKAENFEFGYPRVFMVDGEWIEFDAVRVERAVFQFLWSGDNKARGVMHAVPVEMIVRIRAPVALVPAKAAAGEDGG